MNVTPKIENILEICNLQIVRKGIWTCPPPLSRRLPTSLAGRLLILIQSILNLPENLLNIYLEIAREQLLGGVSPRSLRPCQGWLFSLLF
jgi:hypothetical protein